MSRRTPRWTLAAACAALVVAPLLVSVVTSAPAGATTRCAPTSSKYIGGTLVGQDNRDINAQIGLNAVDKYGKSINRYGCHGSGYTVSIWMNKGVSGDGVVHTSATTRTWRYPLPANAVAVWIEVWTRTNLPKSCAACDGPVDTHRYGFVNRRAIHVNTGNVKLIAPLHCGLGRVGTGSIQGTLRDKAGHRVKFTRIYAWSMLAPDGSKPLQGWGQGRQATTGYYKIDALASGQDYVVWATYGGVTHKRYHVKVGDCKNVPLGFVG